MNWWVANAMACLIVTPAIIAWGTKSNIEWSRTRIIEAVICIVLPVP